ncbi:hypothetical protein, partial [Pseudomonas lurida]|uniref:hypothetical protein n=1 Tax=Pseudomonas lurida TaxID=244566 RepID=UPI0030DAE4B0
QRVIRATGVQGARASRYHVATLRKGIVAIILYLAGMPLSFVSPWLGIGCAMLVAVLWFQPNSPFDRLFEYRTGQPTP